MGKASNRKKQSRNRGSNHDSNVIPLSKALLDVAYSICQNPDGFSLERKRKLISLAAVAWNLSIFPQEQRAEQIQNLAKKLVMEQGHSLLGRIKNKLSLRQISEEITSTTAIMDIVSLLLRKKEELYPDDKRFIVDYKFTSMDNGTHDLVVASINPNDKEQTSAR